MAIEEPTVNIAEIVGESVSSTFLLVRRLNADLGCLETVGVEPLSQKNDLPAIHTDLTSWQCQEFFAWLRRGEVEALEGERPPVDGVGPAVPHGLSGEILAVPLRNERGTQGVLFIAGNAPGGVTAAQRKFSELLRESFTAALENDQHLRDLGARRRMDDADRRSFHTWLGRDELIETVVGADGGLRNVMERVQMIAGSDVPVLILGETGSGKEVIARVIHAQSTCAGGAFIRVNCGAIPQELIDSELFGHERGSFTGAIALRRGWFDQANGGTLLLDEVGELTAAAQVRLLRVLQDGTYQRVGGEKTLHSRVRIIAATNQNLAAMVHSGEFREDLWYRLSVFPLLLPSLRERTEDIPALVDILTRQAARRFGVQLRYPSSSDMRLLAAYGWPGNIRELRSVIERATILGNGKRLEIDAAMGLSSSTLGTKPMAPLEIETLSDSEIIPLDEAMRRHISDVLAITKGRIEGPQGAAALLQINPHTLRARMRKLGIDWTRFRR